MKWMIGVGILMMLLGGSLMVIGHVKVQDVHSAEILGADISVTEIDKKPIPLAVSGSLLGVGAVLTVAGALKRNST